MHWWPASLRLKVGFFHCPGELEMSALPLISVFMPPPAMYLANLILKTY
jgi:hypothetical protein